MIIRHFISSVILPWAPEFTFFPRFCCDLRRESPVDGWLWSVDDFSPTSEKMPLGARIHSRMHLRSFVLERALGCQFLHHLVYLLLVSSTYQWFWFCLREQAYLRVKEREAQDTLRERKLARFFAAWKGETWMKSPEKSKAFFEVLQVLPRFCIFLCCTKEIVNLATPPRLCTFVLAQFESHPLYSVKLHGKRSVS